MVEIVERIGRFTSSNIWKLTTVGTRKMTENELKEHKKQNPKSMKKNIDDGFGAPALTYIEEKRAHRPHKILKMCPRAAVGVECA
jgi:hypothetical protein